jgi:hypothetical protein
MLVRPAWSQNTGDVEKDRQIKGLVMVGLNLTQVDGDEVYGYYKAGLNAGVGASLPLGKGFAFNVETIFNQKGAYKKYTIAGDSSGLPYYHLKLDYVEIPVTFSYEDKHIWTLGLGFSYGRRVSYREIERGIPQDSGSRYGKNDFCILVDLQFRVWKHLKFDMRYQYSMAKIRTRNFGPTLSGDTWTRDQYNNMLTFRALYVLNEKYTPVHKKKANRKKTTALVAPWTS